MSQVVGVCLRPFSHSYSHQSLLTLLLYSAYREEMMNKFEEEDGGLTAAIATPLGNIQFGCDEEIGLYILVDGVHQKDLPVAAKVTIGPDLEQIEQYKFYGNTSRYAHLFKLY